MRPDVPREFTRLHEACEQLRGLEYCTPTVVQALAAVARHETCLNTCPPFTEEHSNYGAIQRLARPVDGVCPVGSFLSGDTSPTSSGGSIAYKACFAHHDTPELGAKAFVGLMTVARPGIATSLPSGNCLSIAQAMYEAHYYEGQGKTPADRIRGYEGALCRNGAQNARDAQVQLLLFLPPPPALPASASASSSAPAPSSSAPPAPAPSSSAVVLVPPPDAPPPPPADGLEVRLAAFALFATSVVHLFTRLITQDSAR